MKPDATHGGLSPEVQQACKVLEGAVRTPKGRAALENLKAELQVGPSEDKKTSGKPKGFPSKAAAREAFTSGYDARSGNSA